MIRRHPIHYIIDAPKKRSKLILFRDVALTTLVWVMYFYFMRAFFYFCGDFFTWGWHGFIDIDAYPRLKILGTIGSYLAISAVMLVLFLSWSAYNILRFGKKTRRKFRPPVTATELANLYNATPKAVGTWQKARVMVMHHDKQGHLTDVMIQE